VYDNELNMVTIKDGQLHIQNNITWGKYALNIEQWDIDQSFITFDGTGTYDLSSYASYNVVMANGTGTLDGPRRSGATGGAWMWGGMGKIQVFTGSTEICPDEGCWLQGWRYGQTEIEEK